MCARDRELSEAEGVSQCPGVTITQPDRTLGNCICRAGMPKNVGIRARHPPIAIAITPAATRMQALSRVQPSDSLRRRAPRIAPITMLVSRIGTT